MEQIQSVRGILREDIMREILFRGQTRRKGEKARMDGTPVESNIGYGNLKIDRSTHGKRRKEVSELRKFYRRCLRGTGREEKSKDYSLQD